MCGCRHPSGLGCECPAGTEERLGLRRGTLGMLAELSGEGPTGRSTLDGAQARRGSLLGGEGAHGWSVLGGLGDAAAQTAAFNQRVLEDLSRLSVVKTLIEPPDSLGILGTDEQLTQRWNQAVAEQVQIQLEALTTAGAQAAADRVLAALRAGDETALDDARNFLVDRIAEQQYLLEPPEAKTFFAMLFTSEVGNAISKIVIFTGATFSQATGFNAAEIEEAYKHAAGRDALTVEQGRKFGKKLKWGAWIGGLVAIALAAAYVLWDAKGR